MPTVVIPQSTLVDVPTVAIPPTPAPTPTPRPKPKPTKTPTPKKVKKTWVYAHLTSYCPGSAGWIAASGLTVYYGMLANNFYPFGTKVYIPVLKMTGQVQDRFGGSVPWNYFDVWSPVCYGTPTGWFKVAVLG